MKSQDLIRLGSFSLNLLTLMSERTTPIPRLMKEIRSPKQIVHKYNPDIEYKLPNYN